LGHARWEILGTATSSPLTGTFSVAAVSFMGVPQVGHASSARTAPAAAVLGIEAAVLFVLLLIVHLVLVDGDHDAVVAEAQQGES
jgi:hypothetical protein